MTEQALFLRSAICISMCCRSPILAEVHRYAANTGKVAHQVYCVACLSGAGFEGGVVMFGLRAEWPWSPTAPVAQEAANVALSAFTSSGAPIPAGQAPISDVGANSGPSTAHRNPPIVDNDTETAQKWTVDDTPPIPDESTRLFGVPDRCLVRLRSHENQRCGNRLPCDEHSPFANRDSRIAKMIRAIVGSLVLWLTRCSIEAGRFLA